MFRVALRPGQGWRGFSYFSASLRTAPTGAGVVIAGAWGRTVGQVSLSRDSLDICESLRTGNGAVDYRAGTSVQDVAFSIRAHQLFGGGFQGDGPRHRYCDDTTCWIVVSYSGK